MKVLLLGYNGWIGKKISKILTDRNIIYIITDLRGEDERLEKFILNNYITHIYCCLG